MAVLSIKTVSGINSSQFEKPQFASGAGAQSRIALGAAVVFGMAMNTLLATVYIPNFYELMQKLQEKFNKKKGNNDKQEGSM